MHVNYGFDAEQSDLRIHFCNTYSTHHSLHCSWFLYSECLHHLKHVHHSLYLTPLNGGGYGTEHARAAHCITTENMIRVTMNSPCTTMNTFLLYYCILLYMVTWPHAMDKLTTLFRKWLRVLRLTT